jgi:hypothetical protein
MEIKMQFQFTKWNQFGDHPLVKKNECHEFEYIEAENEGCGFINTFTIVHPGDYILEINHIFVAVISSQKYDKIKDAEVLIE